MTGPVSRRRFLRLGAVTAFLPFAGCTAAGLRSEQDKPQAAYQNEAQIVYEHDDLDLRILQDTVHVGETVKFEVTNTSDSEVTLGCHNPWALQQQSDGGWRHVTWTSEDYYNLCATILPQGETLIEEFSLTESTLAQQADEVSTELRPGQYRFVLLGTSPYLAVKFTVLESK